MLDDASNSGLVTRLYSEHVARDDCPCSPCRRARRRQQASEVGLSPLEKLDLVPDWKRVLAAIGSFVVVVLVCWGIGLALLRMFGE